MCVSAAVALRLAFPRLATPFTGYPDTTLCLGASSSMTHSLPSLETLAKVPQTRRRWCSQLGAWSSTCTCCSTGCRSCTISWSNVYSPCRFQLSARPTPRRAHCRNPVSPDVERPPASSTIPWTTLHASSRLEGSTQQSSSQWQGRMVYHLSSRLRLRHWQHPRCHSTAGPVMLRLSVMLPLRRSVQSQG